MPMTYVVNAKSSMSGMTVAASNAADALQRAKGMLGSKLTVSITDSAGNDFTVEEFEALLAEPATPSTQADQAT